MDDSHLLGELLKIRGQAVAFAAQHVVARQTAGSKAWRKKVRLPVPKSATQQ